MLRSLYLPQTYYGLGVLCYSEISSNHFSIPFTVHFTNEDAHNVIRDNICSSSHFLPETSSNTSTTHLNGAVAICNNHQSNDIVYDNKS